MSSTQPSSSPVRRNIAIAVGVVLVVAVAAVAWYLTRPEAAPVDIDDALGAATASPGPSSAAPSSPAESPSSPSTTADPSAAPTSTDGTATATGQEWNVNADAVRYDFASAEGTFVGFRIDEELSSIGAATAVARTPAVTGQLVLDDTTINAATVVADLTEITSDERRRNSAIQDALDTGRTRDATFELTEPAELDAMPPVGEVVEVTVTGDLTISGATRRVEIPLEAALTTEDLLVVTGSFEVALADYGIEAPSAPMVVGVADVATVELQLYLQPTA